MDAARHIMCTCLLMTYGEVIYCFMLNPLEYIGEITSFYAILELNYLYP